MRETRDFVPGKIEYYIFIYNIWSLNLNRNDQNFEKYETSEWVVFSKGVTFGNLIQTGKNSQRCVNLTQAFIYGLGSSGVRGGRLCAAL